MYNILIIGLIHFKINEEFNLYNLIFFFFSLIFLIFAFFLSSLLSIPKRFWMKFGEIIGLIITPIILSIIYFMIFLPISIILKLLGIKTLSNEFNKNARSYWIERSENPQSMKKQF